MLAALPFRVCNSTAGVSIGACPGSRKQPVLAAASVFSTLKRLPGHVAMPRSSSPPCFDRKRYKCCFDSPKRDSDGEGKGIYALPYRAPTRAINELS